MKPRKISSMVVAAFIGLALAVNNIDPASASSRYSSVTTSDYPTLTNFIPHHEVKRIVDIEDITADAVCSLIRYTPISVVCSAGTLALSAAQAGVFREAAAEGCGVLVKSTPTGSPRSYDKAIVEYIKICDESVPVPPPGVVVPFNKDIN